MKRLLVTACALGLAACGTDPANTFNDDAGPAPDGSVVPEAGDSSVNFGETSTPDGGGGTLSCSGDLRDVLDANGNVVMTCPVDQGCAGGACVPACAAAAASKGAIGCDYVVATPSFYAPDKPPCFAVFVANSWPDSSVVSVERDGVTYDVSKFGRIAQAGVPETSWAPVPANGIPAGQVAVLFLSHDPQSVNFTPLTCPIPPALNQKYGSAVTGAGDQYDVTGRGKAWHITTTRPATSYDILPYGGASSYLPSAELLYPSSAWGTNYLGVVPVVGNVPSLPEWGQITASQPNTTVTVFPTVSLPAGTNVVAAPAKTSTKYTLGAGDYLQWQGSGDMSGTVIAADKPVSFSGGHTYLFVGGAGDSAHQQIMPISAFGSEYAIAPYTTRRLDLADEKIPYRVVGSVKGTTLTYSPAVAGAPATLDVGQVVDFSATGGFVVSSQDANHPFYVGQVMTGGNSAPASRTGCGRSGTCYLGDEEFVNVLPPKQYLSKYLFFTDSTYATTNLVVTRVATPKGFQDVSLDCVGTLTGWKPLGGAGTYEYTNVDLIRAKVKNGTCDNGPHSASSKGPFGITVWGLDYNSSYGYPAGGNVATINAVVVPPN